MRNQKKTETKTQRNNRDIDIEREMGGKESFRTRILMKIK